MKSSEWPNDTSEPVVRGCGVPNGPPPRGAEAERRESSEGLSS